MRLLKTPAGALLALTALLAALGLATAMVRIDQVTRPPDRAPQPIDMDVIEVRVEEVRFPAADGTPLAGWLWRGEPGRKAIILCHEFGSGKAALLNLMIRLHESGFTLLALDFRGHGDSAAATSTLGLVEKRDVLGAVTLLQQRFGADARPLGVYGAGMGAHAAVLAAADRPALQVLVLDGLYPDVGYPLADRFYGGWPTGVDHLGFVPESLFALRHQISTGDARAEDLLPRLKGRDLLLLSPAGDTRLAREIERMYARIPDQRDADGNLMTLPATATSGLYGHERDRYLDRVASFFEARLR